MGANKTFYEGMDSITHVYIYIICIYVYIYIDLYKYVCIYNIVSYNQQSDICVCVLKMGDLATKMAICLWKMLMNQWCVSGMGNC